ncbi:MAG TPA: HlyD family efflux transporter periplasmic adaptor subunit [Pirellulaceae bacterium]|nr:HlyD family efflux transporter periplasmic adaptor subunit [Pirellulaceae bacterium]
MTRRVQILLSVIILAGVAVAGVVGYRQWQASLGDRDAEAERQPATPIVDGAMPVRLTPQARKNLGLVAKPAALTTYWRKIDVPGLITDRPGVSDRGVVAPVGGVIAKIHAQPGQTVTPSTPLFTIRLVSDELHAAQRELFKASQEIEITRQRRERLAGLAQDGAISKVRLIEIDNDLMRLEATVKAYEQDLQTRGLSAEQLNAAARGKFLKEIVVAAPAAAKTNEAAPIALTTAGDSASEPREFRFEFQELKVELGQQVETGAVLCLLADHRTLLIEGRGFKDDLPLIQQAAESGAPVEVDFEQSEENRWPDLTQELRIQHVANTIDPESRTFAFFIPLENQWEAYQRDDEDRILWQFRPGDRVQVRVAVEKLGDVFVLPREAIVREGPEAYVFRQNGDLFDRRPVHVLAEDRTHVVIANDGSLRPRSYIAQNAAASLNRVLKAQMASGQPTNIHVHADGTTHAAH